MPITHAFVSAKADDPDATIVRPSNWNANHTIVDDIEVPRRFAVGTTAAVNTVAVISSSGAALTTTTQLGVDAICIGTSAATVSIIGARILVGTAAAAYTAAQVVSLYVKTPTKGAGSTITNYYGFYIEAPAVTVNGDKYHMYFGTISGGTNGTNYGIYMESISTAGSSFNYAIYTNAGEVRFGDTLTVNLANKRAIAAQSGQMLGTGGTDTLYVQATWNNAGVTFTGMLMEISNTASGAGSLLANWKFASTSMFSVSKGGVLTIAQGIIAGGASSVTGEFTASSRVAFGTTTSQSYAVLIASGPVTQSTVEVGLGVFPVLSSFATTSGAALYVQLKTVNVTYTMATGYGVRIDTPSKGASNTITTAYGLRIENQNVAGTNYAIWTGTGLVVFGDTVTVATRFIVGTDNTSAVVAINGSGAALSGTSQYGVDVVIVGSAAATAAIFGIRAYTQTVASAFTVSQVAVVYIRSIVKGTGSTITTAYGLLIDDQTVGSTNYAIYTGAGLVRFGGDVTIIGANVIINPSVSGGIIAIQQSGTTKIFIQNFSGDGLIVAANNLQLAGGNVSGQWKITTTGKLVALGIPGVVCANAALNVGETSGFLYIPTCAGTPNGVPNTETGTVPVLYDTTNNKFYAYNGGWKQVTMS